MENNNTEIRKLVELYKRNPQEFYNTIVPLSDGGRYHVDIIKPAQVRIFFIYVWKSIAGKVLLFLLFAVITFPPVVSHGYFAGESELNSYYYRFMEVEYVFITEVLFDSSSNVNSSQGNRQYYKNYQIVYLRLIAELLIIGFNFYVFVFRKFNADKKEYRKNLKIKLTEAIENEQNKYNSETFIYEFTKYYKLMDNKLISDSEYQKRINGLFEKLKIRGIRQDVESFLADIIVLKECGWISQNDLEKINQYLNL